MGSSRQPRQSRYPLSCRPPDRRQTRAGGRRATSVHPIHKAGSCHQLHRTACFESIDVGVKRHACEREPIARPGEGWRGGELAGVLDALGRAIALDSHAPQAGKASLPLGSVDDGAAVSRPSQGVDVAVTAASSAGGDAAQWRATYPLRPEPHRNPASLTGPCRKRRRRRTRGVGRRAKTLASNRHGSTARQSVAARRRLRRKPGKCLAVPCHRGAVTGQIAEVQSSGVPGRQPLTIR